VWSSKSRRGVQNTHWELKSAKYDTAIDKAKLIFHYLSTYQLRTDPNLDSSQNPAQPKVQA
jgi:hypothetical protein